MQLNKDYISINYYNILQASPNAFLDKKNLGNIAPIYNVFALKFNFIDLIH